MHMIHMVTHYLHTTHKSNTKHKIIKMYQMRNRERTHQEREREGEREREIDRRMGRRGQAIVPYAQRTMPINIIQFNEFAFAAAAMSVHGVERRRRRTGKISASQPQQSASAHPQPQPGPQLQPQVAPLHFGPGFLRDLAGRLFGQLESHVKADIFDFCDGLEFGWCSACSGTDSPSWIQHGLEQYFASQGVRYTAPHIVSAESNAEKINFIKAVCRPAQLYDDMYKAAGHKVEYNLISGKLEMADFQKRGLAWYIGFACTTASGLNTKARVERIIDNESCKTGHTFEGVLAILREQMPKTFMLENVPKMLLHGEYTNAKAKLCKLGYIVCSAVMCSSTFGLPQIRERLFIWGFRKEEVETTFMSEQDIEEYCGKILTTLQQGHSTMEIDEFLMSEDDPYLLADKKRRLDDLDKNQARQTKRLLGRTTCSQVDNPKWVGKQSDWYGSKTAASHTQWKPELSCRYPEHKILTDRELETLDAHDIAFPDSRKLSIELSQSKPGIVGPGFTPIVLPRGRMYLAWLVRFLRGPEALALQGIHLPPEVRNKFDSALLNDLAGNAFATPCVLAICIVQLAVLSRSCAARRMCLLTAQSSQLPCSHLSSSRGVCMDQDDGDEECDFSVLVSQ